MDKTFEEQVNNKRKNLSEIDEFDAKRQRYSPTIIPETLHKLHLGPRIEVVFCIDTTVSMEKTFENLKKNFEELTRTLLFNLKGLRLGVLVHGDFPQTKPEPYVTKYIDFSSDYEELTKFFESVEKTYGGDWEEAYEYAFQTIENTMSWSDGCKKVLVIVGDSIPHLKEEYQKIDWEVPIRSLANDGVKIYGIQVDSSQEQLTTIFFRTLAQITGGTHLMASSWNVFDILLGICFKEASSCIYNEIDDMLSKYIIQDGKSITFFHLSDILGLTNEDIINMNNALYRDVESLIFNGKEIPIKKVADTRYIRVGELTFIQQPTCNNKLCTWISCEGTWGIIINEKNPVIEPNHETLGVNHEMIDSQVVNENNQLVNKENIDSFST